ncbi:hypothetical protein F3I62_18920 [Pseudomonas sp. R-28-1W-6]|uniref:hypothetical protein n=1 Tax=Pseudomonas sp. R-28-1W-6 TaxID=2650101 RepID=UPI001365FB47|nr:hypothetical protein [Pseudomonas sp. R-28-1W-6]MWV14178.1 hypothetical protein [Pseudomonas sp. R-28-1W-6]
MKFQLIDGMLFKGLLSVDISTIDLPADINGDEIIVIGIQEMLARARTSNRFIDLGEPSVQIGSDIKSRITNSQAEKYKKGKELRCSPGLAAKIKRKALGQDMGV